MRKVVCILAVLGMVGMASAAEHWRGAGWGGDGTTWGQALNWDDSVPSATTWDANKTGEQGTPKNHDIHIRANGTCGTGTINDQVGYTVNMTVQDGVTMTNSGGLNYYAAGLFTVKTGAFYDMRYGQLAIEHGNLTMVIEEDGRLFCSTLRHNNGTMVDVYGLLEAWTVSRISAEGSYRLSVYDGAEFVVYTDPHTVSPYTGWGDGGRVTQYLGSTVTLRGNFEADYLNFVQAGVAGTWDVDFDGAWTTIMLVPEPASLLLLGLGGLAMMRRRRA